MKQILCVLICIVLCDGGVFAVIGDEFDHRAGLSHREKQLLLDTHNELRAKVAQGQEYGQPPAADMTVMEWDDRLAEDAQRWADTCVVAHNTAPERKQEPWPNVGQNWAANFGAREAVQAWYDEYKHYDYRTVQCSRVCGHYEQIVWSGAVKMGCGMRVCSGRPVLQCHYASGLNQGMVDRQTPTVYKEGQACTACPKGHSFCMGDALCASKQACLKSDTGCVCNLDSSSCIHGTFNDERCECECDEDHKGMRCEEPCRDNIEWCAWQELNGACTWDNHYWLWMTYDCEKTCDRCAAIVDLGARDREQFRVNAGNRIVGGDGGGEGQEGDDGEEDHVVGDAEEDHQGDDGKEDHQVDDGEDYQVDDGEEDYQVDDSEEDHLVDGAEGDHEGHGGSESQKGGDDAGGDCKDAQIQRHCDFWVMIDQCNRNPTTMRKLCPKTCGLC